MPTDTKTAADEIAGVASRATTSTSERISGDPKRAVKFFTAVISIGATIP
jgi:hypothetical protein